MYLIIVGAGDVGLKTLELALRDQNDVVVIDNDENKIDSASSKYDCVFIHGDATIRDTLKDAEADRADAIISTTADDPANMMVMLNAQDFEIPSLVSIVNHSTHIRYFRELGANVIGDPDELIAEYLYRAMQKPSVKNYMKLTKGAEVFEITVTEDSPIIEKTLEEAANRNLIDEETIILAIDREGKLLTPKGDTKFLKGDLVTVFSQKGAKKEITKVFTGEE
ncbi:MAG: TrkA family potassium uptake protein [Candidatus Paceibacterota bacterium]